MLCKTPGKPQIGISLPPKTVTLLNLIYNALRIQWIVLIRGLKAIQLEGQFKERLVMHHHWSIKWYRGIWSTSMDFQKGWLVETRVVVQRVDHGLKPRRIIVQMHNFCGPRRIQAQSRDWTAVGSDRIAWGVQVW